MGYAFDITSGGKLKPKRAAPKEDFIRCWLNLGKGKITEEGGHYPCLAMQFRQSPMKGRTGLSGWIRWQLVPGKKGNNPYSDEEEWPASIASKSWAETGIEDFDVDSLNDLDKGGPCPECPTGILIDEDAFGSLACPDCGNVFESPLFFDSGWKADAEKHSDTFTGTPKAIKKSGSHSKPNLKVWEAFSAIAHLLKPIGKHLSEADKLKIKEVCRWIGMRLPKPTFGRFAPREDDAWLPWVVKTGSRVNGNTLHGYPHLALAAFMWNFQQEEEGCAPLLDNELLMDIHKILLGKAVPGLDNPWRERDVLFVVDILRLMCFDKDLSFDWTPVP
ncbi:MAG: hypothetical protein VCB99_00355 [Myxococcota bacterium]